MRRSTLLAGIVIGSLVSTEVAQACQACISSRACGNSSTRSGCTVRCEGDACICGDTSGCKPKPTFAFLDNSVYNGPGKALHVANGTYLIANCTGSFFGMSYSATKARELKPALDRIELTDARGPGEKRREVNLALFQARAYVYNAALD